MYYVYLKKKKKKKKKIFFFFLVFNDCWGGQLYGRGGHVPPGISAYGVCVCVCVCLHVFSDLLCACVLCDWRVRACACRGARPPPRPGISAYGVCVCVCVCLHVYSDLLAAVLV